MGYKKRTVLWRKGRACKEKVNVSKRSFAGLTIISQKSNEVVVPKRQCIHRICDKCRQKAWANEYRDAKILQHIEDYEQREEGIAMNIKCI